MRNAVFSWWNVLRSPELTSLYFAAVFSGVVVWTLFSGTAFAPIAWGFVSTFFGGAVLIAILLIRKAQKKFGVALKEAAVDNWIQQAGSEEEADIRRRRARNAGSLDKAALMAGFNPHSANIDGTPMISQGIDAYGRPFGVTGLTAPVHNDITGVWVSPGDSYNSPMASSDHGGSGADHGTSGY